MSRRRKLLRRAAGLGDIRGILAAMKNLSLMEIRKLSEFIAAQKQAAEVLERAAQDFAHFFGGPADEDYEEISLLVGSERGFCGEFNELLLAAAENGRQVLVGAKLGEKAGKEALAGANVAEEVVEVVSRLTMKLTEMQSGAQNLLGLTVFFHDEESGKVERRRLFPLPEPATPALPYPPRINLPAVELFPRLAEHYLYTALHEIFYSSLLAENRRRLEHMERAISRVEERIEALKAEGNRLRQEEIIEEIEVILLSVDPASDF